jgi:hypothetical protein
MNVDRNAREGMRVCQTHEKNILFKILGSEVESQKVILDAISKPFDVVLIFCDSTSLFNIWDQSGDSK